MNLISHSLSAWRHARRQPLKLLLMTCCAALLLGGTTTVPVAAAVPPPLKVTVVKVADPQYGNDLLFDVTSNGVDGGGSISISYGNQELVAATLSGKTRFAIPTLDRFYGGNTYRLDMEVNAEESVGTASLTFTPSKITPTVQLVTPEISYGAKARFFLGRGTGPSGLIPGGKALVEVDTSTYEYDVWQGNLSSGNPSLGYYIGTHPIRVLYRGDSNFAPVEWSGTINVVKLPTISPGHLSASTIKPGDRISVSVSPVSGDGASSHQPYGDVKAYIAPAGSNEWRPAGPVASFPQGGTAVVDLTSEFTGRPRGAWQVMAKYLGTEFVASSQTVLPLTVSGQQSSTTVTLPNPERDLGTDESLPVAVRASDPDVLPTGLVRVTEGSTTRGTLTLTDGASTFALAELAPGAHTLTFGYAGDDRTEPSASTVDITVKATPQKSATQVKVTVPNRELEPSELLPVMVSPSDPAVVPTGRVSVTEGSVARGVVNLSDGRGSFALSQLTSGTHLLTFAYAGDASTEASSVTVSVRVGGGQLPGQRAATTTEVTLDQGSVTVGAVVTATATVSVVGGASPGGQVSFLVDGSVVGTQGVGPARTATLSLPASVTAAGGTRTIVARYLGTESQAASDSAARSLVVSGGGHQGTSKVKPKLRVKATASKSRKVRVTATIQSSAPVAGRVMVYARTRKTNGKKSALRVVAAVTISKPAGKVRLVAVTKRLPRGSQMLVIKYSGSDTVSASEKKLKVRVR